MQLFPMGNLHYNSDGMGKLTSLLSTYGYHALETWPLKLQVGSLLL